MALGLRLGEVLFFGEGPLDVLADIVLLFGVFSSEKRPVEVFIIDDILLLRDLEDEELPARPPEFRRWTFVHSFVDFLFFLGENPVELLVKLRIQELNIFGLLHQIFLAFFLALTEEQVPFEESVIVGA